MANSIRMLTSFELFWEGKVVTADGRRSRWRSTTRTLMKVLIGDGPAFFLSSLPTRPAVDTRYESPSSALL